jgi:hypothetical protein
MRFRGWSYQGLRTSLPGRGENCGVSGSPPGNAHELGATVVATPPARCSTVQTRRPPREVNSPADGPAKGSNLNVTLLEQIIAQGPEGNAVPLFRGVALSIPAKKQGSGDVASMIIAGLMTPAGHEDGRRWFPAGL